MKVDKRKEMVIHYEEEIWKLYSELSLKREAYFDNKTDNMEIINAYITFRNDKARDLALKTYNVGRCKRVCMEIFCCMLKEFRDKKILKKGYPILVECPKPDII